MLFIDKKTKDIKNAEFRHIEYYRCRITKKLTGAQCFNRACTICSTTERRIFLSNDDIKFSIIDFIANKGRIDEILIGSPKDLKSHNDGLIKHALPTADFNLLNDYYEASKDERTEPKYQNIHNLFIDLQKIFNYTEFVNNDLSKAYSAYHLVLNLKRRTCTFCNRVYTTTVITKAGKKTIRPELDHWFPQISHPLLGISLYNLIPSCHICNSNIKNDAELELAKHVHPYVNANQTEEFTFRYQYKKSLDEYTITIDHTDSSKLEAADTIKKLKIDQIYGSHIEELKDLIAIEKAYSKSYIKKIRELIPNNWITEEEIYRMLFGVELQTKNFHKRPLSKFKKDILSQLKLIKN